MNYKLYSIRNIETNVYEGPNGYLCGCVSVLVKIGVINETRMDEEGRRSMGSEVKTFEGMKASRATCSSSV